MRKLTFFSRIGTFIKENVSYLVMLVAILLALTLIVGLTFGLSFRSAKKDAVDIGNLTVSDEARVIDNALMVGLNTVHVTGITIDYMMKNGASPDEMERYLTNQSEIIKENIDSTFSGIYGVVNNGEYNQYIDGVGWDPYNPEDEENYDPYYDPYTRPWYICAKEKNGQHAIVPPYVDAQTKSVMISFSKLLSDGVSVISLDKRMNDVYSAAETIQFNGNGYCFVIDKNGTVIAHKDEAEKQKNYLTDSDMQGSDKQKLIQRIINSDNGEVIDTELDGESCMVFSKSVQSEWYVVLVVNNSDLFHDVTTSFFRNIIISFAIFILLAYFCTSNYFNRKKAIRYADAVRTDDLTGLNNRGEFDRYLTATTTGIPDGKQLYLVLFDADNFKGINDKYGHPEGDRALRFIAEATKEICSKSGSFCARYGGDEFVIITTCTESGEVDGIISDITERLDNIKKEYKLPYLLSLSHGYAAYEAEDNTITELIDKADQELYKNKSEKRRRGYAKE